MFTSTINKYQLYGPRTTHRIVRTPQEVYRFVAYTYEKKITNRGHERAHQCGTSWLLMIFCFCFLHNIASTLHGRCSPLALHSFVWGVLRQLFVGFSPPGSGHVPQSEPPYPKIGSKSTFCTIWSHGHHKHPITGVAAP